MVAPSNSDIHSSRLAISVALWSHGGAAATVRVQPAGATVAAVPQCAGPAAAKWTGLVGRRRPACAAETKLRDVYKADLPLG